MSKAIMISIRPKWAQKIANGEKNIEVRRTAPKLQTPFKCYIYCTQHKYNHLYDLREVSNGDLMLSVVQHNKTSLVASGYLNGKVIGEFVCDRIESIFNVATTDWDLLCGSTHEYHKKLVKQACLTEREVHEYAKEKNTLYCWHISDLKIYDKPKELGEFYVWKNCNACKRSGYESTACRYDEDCKVPAMITRPPQSYCYVEEL